VREKRKVESVLAEELGRRMIEELRERLGGAEKEAAYVVWGEAPGEIRRSLEEVAGHLEGRGEREMADALGYAADRIARSAALMGHNVVAILLRKQGEEVEVYALGTRAALAGRIEA